MNIIRYIRWILIVGLLGFLILNPGEITIKWLDYHIELSIVVGVVLIGIILYLMLLVFRTSRFLFHDIGLRRRVVKENSVYKNLFVAALSLFAGTPDKHASFLRRVKPKEDERDGVKLMQALSLKEQGKITAAERILDGLIDSKEYAVPALSAMIDCAKSAKRKYFIKAEQAFLKFSSVPKFIEEYHHALIQNDDFDTAIEHLNTHGKKIMKKEERDRILADMYVEVARTSSKKVDRIEAYRKAIFLHPTDENIEEMVEFLIEKKELVKAKNLIEKYKKTGNAIKNLYFKCFDDVERALEKWHGLTRDQVEKKSIEIELLVLKKHYKKADTKLIKFQKDYPDHPQAKVLRILLDQILSPATDLLEDRPNFLQRLVQFVRK